MLVAFLSWVLSKVMSYKMTKGILKSARTLLSVVKFGGGSARFMRTPCSTTLNIICVAVLEPLLAQT